MFLGVIVGLGFQVEVNRDLGIIAVQLAELEANLHRVMARICLWILLMMLHRVVFQEGEFSV